jgi:hypothetical protein
MRYKNVYPEENTKSSTVAMVEINIIMKKNILKRKDFIFI